MTTSQFLSHAPPNWDCPFCRISGGDSQGPRIRLSDVVHHDPDLTAFLSLHFWENNPGHVLIIPNRHYENLYDMPDDLLGAVAALSKRVALAMKAAYGCDGTSIRQHNEPAGNQDVWHYHLHVFPRYAGDHLYRSLAHLTTAEERLPFAERLRAAMNEA